MARQVEQDHVINLRDLNTTVGESGPLGVGRSASARARAASLAAQARGRRRSVNPTTCERDYAAAEVEFMTAMDAYKRASGRMFPTWSEVLEVLKGLGYEKAGDHEFCG
jgi:hypothetical protein